MLHSFSAFPIFVAQRSLPGDLLELPCEIPGIQTHGFGNVRNTQFRFPEEKTGLLHPQRRQIPVRGVAGAFFEQVGKICPLQTQAPGKAFHTDGGVIVGFHDACGTGDGVTFTWESFVLQHCPQ